MSASLFHSSACRCRFTGSGTFPKYPASVISAKTGINYPNLELGIEFWNQVPGIVPNGGEPMWLTPHQRDSQPEGEWERDWILEPGPGTRFLLQINTVNVQLIIQANSTERIDVFYWSHGVCSILCDTVVWLFSLGGIPVGVIAVETRTVEQTIPADPANLDSEVKVRAC